MDILTPGKGKSCLTFNFGSLWGALKVKISTTGAKVDISTTNLYFDLG